MHIKIESSWQKILQGELEEDYFLKLLEKLRDDLERNEVVYPSSENIFNAFNLCPFEKVKVVILGQDPYHGKGQAHGLSFSVPKEVTPPPSLKNIYKELHADIGKEIPTSGDLARWATQGVLLLNATLTVSAGHAGSHQGRGWETFTDSVIKTISGKKKHVVFLLWGKHAQAKETLIDTSKHLVLKAPHPSPFSAHSGFFGCKHFSKTNTYLEKTNQTEISW